jgi:hypothetical protein
MLSENGPKNKVLITAQKLVSHGFSVIPVMSDSKKADLRWKDYQKRLPGKNELKSWFTNSPNKNLAVICGSISGLVVVDVDKRNGGLESARELHLPPTYTVRTPGGYHYYYSIPPELRIKKSSPLPGIDIQAQGSYVVAPPSTRDGKAYEAQGDLGDITEAPAWVIAEQSVKSDKLWKHAKQGEQIAQGKRHPTAASYAGKLFSQHPQEEWEDKVWSELKRCNTEQFNPPLEEKELRNIYECIERLAKENDSGTKNVESKQKAIIDFVLERDPKLFKTSQGDPYIQLDEKDNGVVHPLKGSGFSYWLRGTYWKKMMKIIPKETVSQVIELLSSIAVQDGEVVELFNRIAGIDDTLFYDLCDDKGQVVEVTASGWTVKTTPQALFKRLTHQLIQKFPDKDGDINLIFSYLNIGDDNQKLLLKAYLVSTLIPDMPHPIPIVFGPHGSAKSTFLRVLRKIIDPSKLELLTFPKKTAELIQILDHHWCPYFDNVSGLSCEESDELCKACTGGGMSKRRLYTDDDDVIYFFKRCVALNGINNIAYRPDLLSRSLMFKLDRIEPSTRKEERIFWEEFEKDLPKILGGVFDVLSGAMANYETAELRPTSRLADFERWGFAIAKAMDHTEQEFADAYEKCLEEQNDAAIESNDVAYVLTKFVDGLAKGYFEGEAQTLLGSLDEKAGPLGVNTNNNYWPRNPATLGRKLNEITNNLLDAGYSLERSRGTTRTIRIESPEYKKSIKETLTDSSDSNDGANKSPGEDIPF